ncbi:MAG: glycosyltransferase [Dictyoglomaceae bacterium]
MKFIVGQFNDSYPPVVDGVANVVRNYAYWLNRKHGECYVITPSYPGYKDTDDFDVIRYFSVPMILRPPYRIGIPFLDLSTVKKIEKIPFHIIHVHAPFSTGLLGLYIAKKHHIPIVATFHTKYYEDIKAATKSDLIAKLGVKLIVEFFNRVDEVWTVSNATAETLREYGFKKKIEVVPNGTDFIPPENKEVYRNKINELYHLREEETVLLYVGQLILQKNLDMLVRSLRILKDSGVSFKAIFVGTGKDEKYLKDLVCSLKLKEDVIFPGKILNREMLKAYYARADLFIFPSLYDTSALVLQEASALGCPSLVIEGATISDGIIDGYNGFLGKNDPENYALRIKELLNNKPLLERVGEEAKKTLYKPWENIVDEVAERYQEIIKKHNR